MKTDIWFSMSDIAAELKDTARADFAIPKDWEGHIEWHINGDVVKAMVSFKSADHANVGKVTQ